MTCASLSSVAVCSVFFGLENQKPVRVSLKVEAHRFLELTDQAAFIPAPYMARAHWVAVVDHKSVGIKVLKPMVKTSYELYFAKLSKKQHELTAELTIHTHISYYHLLSVFYHILRYNSRQGIQIV